MRFVKNGTAAERAAVQRLIYTYIYIREKDYYGNNAIYKEKKEKRGNHMSSPIGGHVL